MKAKLGIILIIFTVISFFIYRSRDVRRSEDKTEKLIGGKIVSAVGQNPINGVTIAVQGTNPRSLSNAEGEYIVMALNNDDLVFRHKDYKTKVVKAKDAKLVKMDAADSANIDEVENKIIE